MKKLQFLLLLLVVLQTSFVAAQKVSNISYRQEQSSIIVSYYLETKTPCKVNLFVSTNGGTTWQGPLTKVTGDVGAKIASGSHNITWNVLEEFEELRGNKIQFQVRADGENIETVVIGTQEWTTKNLNVNKYRNGDIIPEIKDPKKWAKLTTGAWCYYKNDPKNAAIYGKLYNWYAVNDPRGLAPKGFHIPSFEELGAITSRDTLATGAMIGIDNFMKSFYKNKIQGDYAISYNGDGFRVTKGHSYFWCNTEYNPTLNFTSDTSVDTSYAFALNISFGYNLLRWYNKKCTGYPIRCIKD